MSATHASFALLASFAILPAPRAIAQTAGAPVAIAPASVQGAATADAAPSPEQIQRSEKIAAALSLNDPDQVVRVRDIIARQYADLGVIHAARDAALKSAKDATGGESAIQAVRDAAASRQADLHYSFLARLAGELSPAQVDQVKDGLTYSVAPNTYRVYLEMLPQINTEQKRQILVWLTEAREHAQP